MYSKNLISGPVRKSHTFDDLYDQSIAGMTLPSVSKLEKRCKDFIQCFNGLGSPGVEEIITNLIEELEKEMVIRHSLLWSLTSCEHTELEIQSHDQIAVDLKALKLRFGSLLRSVRNFCRSSKCVSQVEITHWLGDVYDLDKALTRLTNIDYIFDELLSQDYHFLNYEILTDLNMAFPFDSDLQQEMFQYIEMLKKFESSIQIQEMKSAIDKGLNTRQPGHNVACQVVIKLCGCWTTNNMENFRKLIAYLFKDRKKNVLGLIEIIKGSITFVLEAPAFLAVSLLQIAELKNNYLCHLGVLELTINSIPLNLKPLSSNDNEITDVSFTFEQSLLHAIKNIPENDEYKEIALLLIQFEIDLSFQNKEGETAETLANAGGHIDILMALQKKASGQSIIKQESFMITTSASQASIQDVTTSTQPSVDPQKLVTNFQNLNARFTTALTQLITEGTVLLSDIKQYLQLYTEGITTEINDIHQLIDFLQSHYSYLNVKPLNDISRQFLEQEIQDQADSYIKELGKFESSIQLLELKATMDQYPMQQHMGEGQHSKLVIKFNFQWSIKTIADLHKFEEFLFSYRLNLNQIYQEDSLLVCVYLVLTSQHGHILSAITTNEQIISQIGVCQVSIENQPIIQDEDDTSFNFEAVLQQAIAKENDSLISLLMDLNTTMIQPTTASQGLPDKAALEAFINSAKNLPKVLEEYSHKIEELTRQMIDQKELHDTFVMYCKTQKIDEVKQLITQGVNVNYHGADMTPLIAASSVGNCEIINLLLENGAEINDQLHDGMTALMVACAVGNYEVVDLLITNGAHVDFQSRDGMSALAFTLIGCAVFSIESFFSMGIMDEAMYMSLPQRDPYDDYLPILIRLLDTNPVIFHVSLDGITFHLILFAVLSPPDLVKLILDKSQGSNEDILCAFILSCALKKFLTMTLLFDKLPLTSESSSKRELLVAILEDDLENVMNKLSENPDTLVVGDITPLMIAACLGHTQLVDHLIKAGANVNAVVTFYTETFTVLDILRQLAEGNHITIIALLVRQGAKTASILEGRNTPSKPIFQNILGFTKEKGSLGLINNLLQTFMSNNIY